MSADSQTLDIMATSAPDKNRGDHPPQPWNGFEVRKCRSLLVTVFLFCLSIGFAPFGLCTTIQGRIDWVGDAGWRVTADFIYNSELPENQLRDDFAPEIEFLTVVIHDPANDLIARYNNVMNGNPFYTYLSFHFDPLSLQLAEGEGLDIGEDPGYWLSGTASDPYDYALVRDNYDGRSGDDPIVIVDQGGSPVITIVPEPSCSLLAFLGVIPWLMRRSVRRGLL